MGISINVEQLIHEAVDVKNGQINQHLLVKLLEVIVRQSNIHTLNVDLTENDAQIFTGVAEIPLTTDIQDNSSSSCDLAESIDESMDSIYKLPSEATISEPEIIEDNVDKISTPSTLSLNRFLEEKHEYCLQKNDRHVVAELIEKLFGKIKKIDSATKLLKKSIKTFNEDSDSFSDSVVDPFKEIAFSDMGLPFIVEKHDYDRLQLDENLKKLEISSKGETFRDIYGSAQKRKDLHLNVSLLHFREFDLDYRTNFRTIQTFIELHRKSLKKAILDIEELKKNSLNKDEFKTFQKVVISTHTQMKNNINEYILRDPEAMGIVRFVNDGSCMSCGEPAIMKTTNTATLKKNVPTRRTRPDRKIWK